MSKEVLTTILEEFFARVQMAETNVPRDLSFSKVDDKIKVAIGMRRVGKTSLLFKTAGDLLVAGVAQTQILYINFEDDRLLPCDQQRFVALLDAFYSLYPQNHERKCFLFLDEIQNVEGWAQVVRRFQDTKDVELFLSGSSSKLLSKDLPTALRGRSIATEVWPFSFKEYLKATKYELSKPPYSVRIKDQLSAYLETYLRNGGFPGTVKTSDLDRSTILQEYVELVIIKDIVERYNVENIVLLKYLILSILKNISGNFSANKFANDIKSQGMRGAKATILDYLEYLEDAYLIFSVKLFSESVRKSQINDRKLYAIDPGLVNAYTFSKNHNFGHLFENMFYLHLRRTRHKIHYYLTQDARYEVDFFVEAVDGTKHLYQVCWDTSAKDTYAREQRALEIAMQELNVPGTIITPEVFFGSFIV